MPEWKRLFTLQEATAALDELRPILAEIVEVGVMLTRALEGNLIQPHARQNGHARSARQVPSDEADQLAARYRDLIQRVLDMGVELKDPSTGLVDFPSMRDGRIVYLCWRLGESGIGHWHEIDAGFAGRQPL